MKKVCLFVVCFCAAVTVLACPPPHRHHRGGNSGIRLATDIVNLVGAGLDVLRPPTAVIAPGYGYPGTVVVMPPPAPAVVACPPPASTLVQVPGSYDQFGRPIYQRVVYPDNVQYVTAPVPPPVRRVYVPGNPYTPTVIQ